MNLRALRHNFAPRPIFWLVISVIAVVGVVAGCWIEWQLEHIMSQTVPSPSGKSVAAVYLMGEGTVPAYGESVEIYPASNPLGKFLGETVFAGHCKNTVSVRWRSEDELLIHCSQPDSIAGMRGELGNTRIQFE